MKRGFENNVSRFSINTGSNSSISRNDGYGTTSAAPLSPVTKLDLERQLQLRTDLLHQIDKSHQKSQINIKEKVNACCTKCSSEFSILKTKQTCMNW
jgi:hypothetical protein